MIVQNLASEALPGLADIYRLSVGQYHDMIAAGIFAPDDKLELLEGCLIATNPIGDDHLFTVDELYLHLLEALPTGWKVYMQHPITLGDSEPEPDVVVVRGTGADYKRRKPGPKDVGLVIEVADISLQRDRGFKADIYSAAGIPEYWIVNLIDRQVEVYRNPSPPVGESAKYASPEIIAATGSVQLLLEGKNLGALRVSEVLP